MAKQFDAGVECALRRASAVIVDNSRRVWNLALAGGLTPARARIRDGWFEVRASLPDAVLPEHDDLWALGVNARLCGRARIARPCGEAPFVKADVFMEHTASPFDLVQAACLDVTRAVATIGGASEDILRDGGPDDSAPASKDIERACDEAGWHWVTHDGGSVRVELPTRARLYSARLESMAWCHRRFIVELVDLAGGTSASTRAVSALLLAASASVHSVSGVILDREGARWAALTVPLETPLDGSVDRALSALSVACALAGREAVALRDPQLASDYLALSQHTNKGVRPLFHRNKGSDPFFQGGSTCQQQPQPNSGLKSATSRARKS